ncbi:MAG: N-acetylmuramoyl-L-alanine amidase, partial [Actinomyces urogenitalis]|nr:N-acetylmuramoyl-L-alanine amidase [Actinomyces urogenitalis]MDU0875042.1 N-acetylmuramoyl-L-alanine amidase [Actinomyces urogenitalis]MDU6777704.1 N-acetylmuramoyl-L-alanine amidase [Actinomyces urogenitalis]
AVIRGEYGNGDERRHRLGNLYDQVQQRVNAKLS